MDNNLKRAIILDNYEHPYNRGLVTNEDYDNINADLLVGSLIKNLGAGICNNGAYIAGRKELMKIMTILMLIMNLVLIILIWI